MKIDKLIIVLFSLLLFACSDDKADDIIDEDGNGDSEVVIDEDFITNSRIRYLLMRLR